MKDPIKEQLEILIKTVKECLPGISNLHPLTARHLAGQIKIAEEVLENEVKNESELI